MQFTRTQTVLASILFVQVVLILLLRSPLTGGGAAPEPGLLLPELADLGVNPFQIFQAFRYNLSGGYGAEVQGKAIP